MERVSTIPELPEDGAPARRRLVVIGNGMAGARAVEEILRRNGGERFEITVFGEEPGGSYNRVLLSEVLLGARQERDVALHPLTWYVENGVRLHVGERATRVDREHRVVYGARGSRIPYDLLLLATGSRAAVPAVEGLRGPGGALRPGVFVFRTLEDCRRMRAHAGRCRTAVVIGGGLLGLEAARGLREHGLEVHVVHRGTRLMDRQLDAAAAGILRGAIEKLGVKVHLERRTAGVLGETVVSGVRFEDGAELPCEMVVLACGVQPNVELARGCGLPVDRAILVDDQLRTADPHIVAVGECVQHRGEVYGLVAPLWEQAAVLADHLTGHRPDAVYCGSRTVAKLKVMGIELAAMGEVEPRDAGDEVVQYVEARRGIYKKLLVRDGKLAGAILLGDPARAPYLIQAFERGTPLPHERAELLFNLGGADSGQSVLEMPDAATVCHCNGVTKGDLRECVLSGACGLHAVVQATRAGTGCGSCKPLVKELVDRFAREGAEHRLPALPPAEERVRVEA